MIPYSCNFFTECSTNGLGLKSLNPHEIKKGDIRHVLFQLSPGIIIKKKVVIRNIQDEYVGCEFIDDQAKDKGIDFKYKLGLSATPERLFEIQREYDKLNLHLLPTAQQTFLQETFFRKGSV